jgi:hypothetical protein
MADNQKFRRGGDRTFLNTQVEMLDLGKKKKFVPIRYLPGLATYFTYGFRIKTPKTGKIITIEKMAQSFDIKKGDFDESKTKKDPWRKLAEKYGVRGRQQFAANVIDRRLQEDAPRKEETDVGGTRQRFQGQGFGVVDSRCCAAFRPVGFQPCHGFERDQQGYDQGQENHEAD